MCRIVDRGFAAAVEQIAASVRGLDAVAHPKPLPEFLMVVSFAQSADQWAPRFGRNQKG